MINKVIYQGRGTGKTSQLVILSDKKQIPILCYNKRKMREIQNRAIELNCNIPEPVLFSFNSNTINIKPQDVLIDDVDLFLGHVFQKYNIKAMTISSNSNYVDILMDLHR